MIMKLILNKHLKFLWMLTLAILAADNGFAEAHGPHVIPGHYIVVLKQGVPAVEVIRTHHLDLGLTSATPTIGRRAALRDPAAPPAATVPRGQNGALFAAAIERYHRAVEVRATVDSPAATAEERAAARHG